MRMRKENQVSILNYLMLALNWISIIGLTGFVCITTKEICSHYIAREFLDEISHIPWEPVKIMRISIFLMTLITVAFLLREYVFAQNSQLEIISLFFEFAVSVLLVAELNFNYNGILLLVFAHMISHNKRSRNQMLFILLAIVAYVITDFGLISVNLSLFNVENYIDYYSSTLQSYLLAVFNLMSSLNIVLFIAYCVFVIRKQQGTIDQVNELYARLSRANEDLRQANTELHDYALVKEKMGETKERNRLAREIHDTLGHTLTGISVGLDACIAIIDASPEKTKEQLVVLSDVTRKGIKEVRRSVSELRPDALERFGLEYAIRKMVNDSNSMTNTRIIFDCRVEHLRFDEDEENAIYRVVQESVTNAIRHGNASEITILMEHADGKIHITIKDNGCGCDTMKAGFGTKHIKERISMLKGTVSFDGSDGFLVDVRIPIRWGEEYD